MARTPNVSDEQIIARLTNEGPLTAAQLEVPAARLHRMEHVIVSGRVQTGRRGRPALLFALGDQLEA